MYKYASLGLAIAIIMGFYSTAARAQEGARVAVMPVQMAVEGAQLEQLNRIGTGLMSVIVGGLADLNMMVLTMDGNASTLNEDAAHALALGMGADYLFSTRITKKGDLFNLTGHLQALTSNGKSSKRVMAMANSSTQLPHAVEQLLQLATDHLYEGGAPVVSVSVEGSTMVDSQSILNSLRIQAGGSYNEAKTSSDIRRIYALGFYDDVRVEVLDVPGGKGIRYLVQERNQLNKVVFRGQKMFEAEDLEEVVNIKPNDIPSEVDIAGSVENIKRLYIDKGYPNVQVMTSIESADDGRGVLVYNISEGGKIYIQDIEFEGNEFYSDWTLSGKIDTTSRNVLLSWINGSGKLNQEKLSGDSQKLESFYQNSGFLQAKVGEPMISNAEGGGLIVTFPIREGMRYKVGDVSIGGALLEDDKLEEIMKYITIGDETWFSREIMQEDVKSLQTYYSDKGYAHNSVEPNITDGEDGKLNLEFIVQPKNKVYFDRITIVGNDKTRDRIIRRQLAVVEGDQFSSSAIQGSQANLMRSSYFEQVNLTPGPSDSDDKMNLRVEVKERPTGAFQIGGGYSNYNSIFGVIKMTQDNLFGHGRQIAVEANVGSKNQLFDISFTDPWVFDIPLAMGVDLFRYENEYDYYTKASTGASLRAGYPLGANFYISGSYTLENIDILDSDPGYGSEFADYEVESIFDVTVRRDTRNHFFFPSRGSIARFSYSKASEFLGGNTNYSRYEAESAVWLPIPFFRGASVMFHGEVGHMTEDGKTKDGLPGLPSYEKYMLGGINSVRGYEWFSISPENEYGLPVGGESMMVLNAELSFPILKEEGVYGVAFVDAGQVWAKGGDVYSLGDLRKSIGGGLRYLSPMGPFRVEYGYPLDQEEGEEGGQWEFTMGSMF